ncbi:protein unc-93 A [Biomphalaria glabrata]|nr:protein unc-93 A [Biomphalaria glabrata]
MMIMGSGEVMDPTAEGQWMSWPMKNCLVLSLSFTFVYTAYLAIQNLQSSLNQEANLGVVSLSVLYGSIILFGTQSPLFIRYVGAKRVLLLAWFIHTLYTASNFYPTFATLIPTSALLGAIAGPMWTSQGMYISAAGEKYAALQGISTEADLHAVLSKFNGIFFMFYEVTQVTGNMISSFVLSTSSYNTSLTDGHNKICGPDDCPFSAQGTNVTAAAIQEPEKHVVYTLLGVFLACNVCGFMLTLFGLPQHTPTSRAETDSVLKDVVSCFKMTVDSRMLLMLPLFMGQAMAVGVLYADYTKAYISCALGVRWVGYIMTSYGICTAIFAIGINSLAGPLGRLVLFTVAVIIDTGTLVGMLLWQPRDESVIVYFLIPAFSGISEGIMQAQFNTLIAQVFKENISPAFATYHTSKATSFTITFVLSTFICLRPRLYISIALYLVGLVGYVISELRLRRKQSAENKEVDDQNMGSFSSQKKLENDFSS